MKVCLFVIPNKMDWVNWAHIQWPMFVAQTHYHCLFSATHIGHCICAQFTQSILFGMTNKQTFIVYVL